MLLKASIPSVQLLFLPTMSYVTYYNPYNYVSHNLLNGIHCANTLKLQSKATVLKL